MAIPAKARADWLTVVGLGAWAAEGVEAKIGPSDGQVFDDFAAQYLDIWQEIGEK